MVKDQILYLYDPLCGWCYGASPMLERLRSTGVVFELVATGLFSGSGARPMDEAFAAYAWTNDQRINRLTGQVFSDRYRVNVLDRPGTLFDSAAATLAVTAAGFDDPQLRFDALKTIQHARYVEGLDITDLTGLVGMLEKAGMTEAAARLADRDEALLAANRDLLVRRRQLFERLHVDGVPALVIPGSGGGRLLGAGTLFGSYDNLIAHLQVA